MKVATNRHMQVGGVLASGVCHIAEEDAPFIMNILRNSIYTDKVLAVVREYSTNAWDAHRSVGKDDVPIKVTMPTHDDPYLKIRDFGPGLSQHDALHVYTGYGKSTKRNTNRQNGMLGIGSKAGYSYADQFTVVSWYDGTKSIYQAALDETDRGIMNLLHREPCGDETGIEIQVLINRNDIWEFGQKARYLYPYFKPLPDINIEIPKLDVINVGKGAILKKGTHSGMSQWVAVMGCNPYRVDIRQIQTALEDADLWNIAHHLSGILYFDMGEVDPAASREDLEYNKRTKAALLEQIAEVIHTYTAKLSEDIRSDKYTGWEKRMRVWALLRDHGYTSQDFPLPGDVKRYIARMVSLWKTPAEAPKTFTLLSVKGTEASSTLNITPELSLLYKRDRKALSGYNIGFEYRNCYVIRPVAGIEESVVKAELDLILKAALVDGIPIETLEDKFPWVEAPKAEREKNIKHRVTVFTLVEDPKDWKWRSLSSNWNTTKGHEPSDEDVFEIIHRFNAVDTPSQGVDANGYPIPSESFNLYETYKMDCFLGRAFGVKVPKIIGYKTTSAKPVTPENCKGTSYREWRKGFVKTILKVPDVRAFLGMYRWSQLFNRRDWEWYCFHNKPDQIKAFYEGLDERLGADHPISYVFRMYKRGTEGVEKYCQQQRKKGNRDTLNALETLDRKSRQRTPASKRYLDAILELYPLLRVGGSGLQSLGGRESEHWFQYIEMMDIARNVQLKA